MVFSWKSQLIYFNQLFYYSTGLHLICLLGAVVDGESQQYPAASQAGPQAYFLNTLVDELSQVHCESAVGF